MWKWLLHFNTVADYNSLALTCPPPPAGQPAAPLGFYDGSSVAAAFNMLAFLSVIAVLVIVMSIYLGTRRTLGPRFVFRWYKGIAAAAIVCALLALIALALAPTHALANSCETDPNPFLIRLPGAIITSRAVVGLAWGAIAYVVFSLVLVATAGRFPSVKNGFFHNRGCPWPRFIP